MGHEGTLSTFIRLSLRRVKHLICISLPLGNVRLKKVPFSVKDTFRLHYSRQY